MSEKESGGTAAVCRICTTPLFLPSADFLLSKPLPPKGERGDSNQFSWLQHAPMSINGFLHSPPHQQPTATHPPTQEMTWLFGHRHVGVRRANQPTNQATKQETTGLFGHRHVNE